MKKFLIPFLAGIAIILLIAAQPKIGTRTVMLEQEGSGTNTVLFRPTATLGTNTSTTTNSLIWTILPPDGHPSNRFYIGATAAANAGNASRSNAGFFIGANFNATSVGVLSGEPSLGFIWESNYEPTTNEMNYEWYMQYYGTNGSALRPIGVTIHKRTSVPRLDFSSEQIYFSSRDLANNYLILKPLGAAGGDGGQADWYGTLYLHQSTLNGGAGILADESTKIRFRDIATTNQADISMSSTNLVIDNISTAPGNLKLTDWDAVILEPASLILRSNVTNQVRLRIGSGNDAVIERMAGSASGSLLISNWTDVYFTSTSLRNVPNVVAPAASGIAIYAGAGQAVQLFSNNGNHGWFVATAPGALHPAANGSQDLGMAATQIKDIHMVGAIQHSATNAPSLVVTNNKANGTIFTSTANAGVTNTTTEATVIGAGQGTLTLPANFLIPGRTIRITVAGIFSDDAAAPGTVTVSAKFGSTTLATTGAQTPIAAAANAGWKTTVTITCRTSGASGTVMAHGSTEIQGTALAESNWWMLNTGTATIDTTATQAIDVIWDWGTADSDNSTTGQIATVEVLR